MIDVEKLMKPIFEKHIPTIIEAFEKNKKKDFLMTEALKHGAHLQVLVYGIDNTVTHKSTERSDEEFLEFIKKASKEYDRMKVLVEQELKK